MAVTLCMAHRQKIWFGLFDKAYMFTDLFNGFILFLVEDNLVLLEQVPSVGVNGHDQRSELMHSAGPQRLRHTEVLPVGILNLLYRSRRDYRASRGEYTVQP